MSSGVSDLSDGVSLPEAFEPPPRTPGDRLVLTDNVHSPEHILSKQGSGPPEGELDSMIRRAFLWFMTDLLVDHSRFTNGKFDGGFDQAGFLAKCSETERPFLKELTSTQMWASWISRRLLSGEDSKDIVLFDEVIAQKLNRKTFMFSKTATPFLSLDFSEKGHYREVRVPDPPRGSVAEPEDDRTSRGAVWQLDENRLYKPRPMEAMPVPTVSAERPGVVPSRDPLPSAPLVWYVQHCWLLSWAAYLPDRPEQQRLQWAKMDLCLSVLHKMTPGDPRDQSSPPPHDLALSMLAAACARCGALRVDLAERLFTWMKVRRLVAATHPQSLSVFFERFVQLCASDSHEGPKGLPQAAVVSQSPGEAGQPPETGRGQPGNSPRPLANAGLLLFQDLKARPRMDCAPKPTLPRLTFSLQCRFCAGKISLEDVDAQWGRPGAEASSKFQCPHCRTESTLKLRVETGARDLTEIDLLHPKRLGMALRELESLTGPAWLARLARDYPHWHLNLLWQFRRHGLFDEHMLTALEPEKASSRLTNDGTVVRSDARSRLRSSSDSQSVSETLQCQAGTMNSVLSLSNPSQAGTFEVWSEGQTWTHEGSSRRNSKMGSEMCLPAAWEVSNQVELLTVERLRMQMEDLRGQLHRKSQVSEEREEAESVARKALGRAYGKVLEETVLPEILCSKARQSEVAGVAAQHVLGRAYDKVLEGIKALPHEPCERQGTVVLEEKVVLRWVAKDAVARAVTGALCRMLPAGSAGECQAPTRQADANGSQIREPPHADATMLSDSRATGDPGGQEDEMQMTPTSHQEALEACQRESELEKSTCWGSTSPGDYSTDGTGHEVLSAASQEPGILPSVVPPGWDVKSTDNGDGGPNDSEQVELEDDLSELQFRERVDRRTRMWKLRKMRRAWRIWRTAAQHASSRDEDGEEEKESEVVEAEEAQEGLDAGNQPAEGQSPVADSFAEADGLETHEPKEAKRSESEALELDAEAGECKDTLQDKDFARSSSREPAGPIETRAPQTELEPKELRTPRLPSKGDDETRTVEAHLKDLDTDISDVERHDGSAHDGIPRIRKPLAPPLVPCNDIDAWSTRRRAHPHSQQSAFLTSARDSCALPDPQPRRSASAPPERRKRGRRHKIVPRVISTGLATAPTSAVHSPNSVFPTPLLPRERSQASRALAPERGRDRRSKSVTTVTAVSAW